MKNKKATYILIPAVILIWGLIFYKFISGLSGNDSPPAPLAHADVTDASVFLPDTFSLNAAYRDPFLGKQTGTYANSEDDNNQPVAKSAINKIPPPAIVALPWPAINYGGVIKSMKYDKQVAIITIDGKEYLFKQGDMVAGMQAISVFKDSVKLKRDKEVKMFYK